MIGNGGYKSLTLVIRFVYVDERRQHIALQCLVNTLGYIFHRVVCKTKEFLALIIVGLVMQARQRCGQTFQVNIGQIAVGNPFQQFLQRDSLGIRTFYQCRYTLSMFCNANRIYQEETILTVCIGRNGTQLLVVNGTNATAFHLYIKRF